MNYKLNISKLNINTDFYKFLITGILVVFIDGLFYFLLTLLEFTSFQIAKRISFLIGAFFAFILNRNYVFLYKKRNFSQVLYFVILYIMSFFVNSFVHDYILVISNISLMSFIFATAVSATLNYLVMKFFIFKK